MMAINGSLFSFSTYTIDFVSGGGGVNKSDVFFPCESKPALTLPCPPLKVSAQETAVTFQSAVPASKAGLGFVKSQKWWEKGIQLNMKDITSAQDLAESLQNVVE